MCIRDSPYFTHEDHTLNIDFVNESLGIDARVAVEMTAESARELIQKITLALEAGEAVH